MDVFDFTKTCGGVYLRVRKGRDRLAEFVDSEKPKGKAKLLAERAAVVDARRNLLEIIKGVYITSETVVEDYMVSSDIVV